MMDSRFLSSSFRPSRPAQQGMRRNGRRGYQDINYEDLGPEINPAMFRRAVSRFQEGFFEDPRAAWPQSRTVVRRAQTVIPFDRAMRHLHQQLNNAEGFYRRLLKEFKTDTNGIAPYAEDSLIARLWCLKVTGGNRSQNEPTENRQARFPQSSIEEFENTKDVLLRALRLAVDAKPDEGPEGSRRKSKTVDASRRMQGKVATATEQISDLLDQAMRSHDHCEALHAEIEELKRLVDPAEPRNKELYTNKRENQTGSAGDEEGVDYNARDGTGANSRDDERDGGNDDDNENNGGW